MIWGAKFLSAREGTKKGLGSCGEEIELWILGKLCKESDTTSQLNNRTTG